MAYSLVPDQPSYSLVPDEEDKTVKKPSYSLVPEEKRESQHLRQFGAGILDIGAGIPALAGIVATPFKAGYHMISDDMGAKDALLKGLDNPAMRLSGEMREGINDIMGVEEPEGLEQLSRLGSMLIPLGTVSKGAGLVAKAAGAGAKATGEASTLGKVAKASAPYVLPFIQTTEGASKARKAAEVGAQVGITVGADQGIRYATDAPTIASSYSAIDDSLIENPGKTAVGTAAIIAFGLLGRQALTERAAHLAKLADDASINGASIPKNIFGSSTQFAPKLSTRLDAKIADATVYVRDQVEQLTGDTQLADDVQSKYKTNPAASAGVFWVNGKMPDSAITVDADTTPAAIQEHLNTFTPDEVGLFNGFLGSMRELNNRIKATMTHLNPETANIKSPLNPGKPTYIDRQISRFTTFAQKLRGEIADAERVIAEGGLSSAEQHAFIQRTEKRLKGIEGRLNFWQSFGEAETVVGKSGKTWRIQNSADGSELSIFNRSATAQEQLEFLEDIGADRVQTGFLVGDNKTPFLNNPSHLPSDAPAAERQLWNTIKQAKANPKVMAVVKKYAQLSSKMLDYYVESGRLSPHLAQKWRDEHTLDGLLVYMHGREAVEPDLTLAAKLKYILGWDTPEADDAARPFLTKMSDRFAKIKERAREAKEAAKNAIAKDEPFQNALPPVMQKVAVDYRQGITNPMAPMAALESSIASMFEHVTQNKARLFAMSTLDNALETVKVADKSVDAGAIVKRYDEIDPETGKAIWKNDELHAAIQSRHGTLDKTDIERDMLVSVFEDGKKVRYYVPSKEMQHALKFHPNLVKGIHKIGATTKNIYQAGTTRNIFFAIPQMFFSTYMAAINARAYGVKYNLADAARGIKEVFANGMGNEISQHLDNIVASNPTSRFAPFAERFKQHMKESVSRSLMMEMVGRTGGASSGSMVVDSMTKVAKVSNQWAEVLQLKGAGNIYASLKGIWRAGAILNRALQDGPTVGLMMKAMKKELNESYNVNLRPIEIDGTKIKYGKTNRPETPFAYYDGEGTIHIDVDALKKSFNDGTWRKDNEFFKTVPNHFDDADDFAEFVLNHELAHVDQHRPQKGFVRLYRGETDDPNAKPIKSEWLDDAFQNDPVLRAQLEAAGRWFTHSKEEALYYNKRFGIDDGRVSYVDVPEGDVQKYLAKNHSEAKRFASHADDNPEYFLPSDLAKSRTQIMKGGSPEREADANIRATKSRDELRNTAALRANKLTKDIAGDYTAYGSSDRIRAIRAWVPFSGAAIHGLRALGRAWARDPVKTSAMITGVVMAPMAVELSMLYMMGSDEQKELFWRQSDSARLSNVFIPNPDGKSFTQLPVEPSLRVVRGIFLEGIDAVTNWSNQYRPYKVEIADGSEVEQGQFLHAFITGLQSIFNLPLPPLAQAALAARGQQAVLGLDPNAEDYLGGIRPLAGQQVTAMGRDQTSMPDAVMSSNVEGIITALGGFAGGLAVSTFNQFNLGKESDIFEKTGRAVGEVASKLGSYSRIGTLFGQDDATRITRASHIDRELRPMLRGLKQMQAVAQAALNGQMLPGGVVPAGNAPLAPDDYDTVMLASNAAMLAKNPRFKQAGTRVATAFKQLSVIKSSDRIQEENIGMLPWLSGKSGEPWTRELKHRAENELATIINQERVMQIFLMKQHEEMLGFKFSDFAGKAPPLVLDKGKPVEMADEEVMFADTPEVQQQPSGSF